MRLIRLFLFFFSTISILNSCAEVKKPSNPIPSWYISPKSNDSLNLYGVGEGYTIKEATNDALANISSKLIVDISANSSLIRQENQSSINEEFRQNIEQKLKKITFSDYQLSHSANVGQKFFTEVKVNRDAFASQQKRNISQLLIKVRNIDQNSSEQIAIFRKKSLEEIVRILREIEILQKVVEAAGFEQEVKKTQANIAKYESEILKLDKKIEVVFDINSPTKVTNIIQEYLNETGIKTSRGWVRDPKNQILLKVTIDKKINKIYGSYITKLKLNFNSYSYGKVVASGSSEVSGSSTIDDRESFEAALKKFSRQLEDQDIFEVIGIREF